MMKRKNKNIQRNSRRFFLTFFGFFLFLFSALLVQGKCPQRTGPVDILPGDVCSFCGMHITEKKFSGQYITSDGKVKKFDDIGCLVSSYIKEKEKVKKFGLQILKLVNGLILKMLSFPRVLLLLCIMDLLLSKNKIVKVIA